MARVRRDNQINVRVSDAMAAQLKLAADLTDDNLTGFCREAFKVAIVAVLGTDSGKAGRF